MYIVVVAWTYVVLLMGVAEAFSPQGSVLGALVTVALYGALPLSIVVYILGTPARKRALRQAQLAQDAEPAASKPALASSLPQQPSQPNSDSH